MSTCICCKAPAGVYVPSSMLLSTACYALDFTIHLQVSENFTAAKAGKVPNVV